MYMIIYHLLCVCVCGWVGRAAKASGHYLSRRWFSGCAANRQLSGRGRRRPGGAEEAGGSRGHRLPTQSLTQRHLPAPGSGHTAATAPVRRIHTETNMNPHTSAHLPFQDKSMKEAWRGDGAAAEDVHMTYSGMPTLSPVVFVTLSLSRSLYGWSYGLEIF